MNVRHVVNLKNEFRAKAPRHTPILEIYKSRIRNFLHQKINYEYPLAKGAILKGTIFLH